MKLNIFASTTADGIMSSDKKYFPNLTKEERELLYKTTKERYFHKHNLNIEQVILLPENASQLKSRVVTENTKKIKEKVLILKSTTPNLAVAIETVDTPVIVASANIDDDKSVSAIALGTLENINNDILHEMIGALMKETDAAPFEMTFYIGACPNKDEYVLSSIDNLTNNILWKDAITKKKNKYYIDLRYAIFNQLISAIVDPNYIYFDTTSTVTSPKYYSNYSSKLGKNIITVVYKDE